ETVDRTGERDVLTAHAERRRTAAEGIEMLVGERPQGTFSRQLFRGDTLDADRIDADYADGVVTLRLPIAEQAKPRRVPITVAERGQAAIDAHSEEQVA